MGRFTLLLTAKISGLHDNFIIFAANVNSSSPSVNCPASAAVICHVLPNCDRQTALSSHLLNNLRKILVWYHGFMCVFPQSLHYFQYSICSVKPFSVFLIPSLTILLPGHH